MDEFKVGNTVATKRRIAYILQKSIRNDGDRKESNERKHTIECLFE